MPEPISVAALEILTRMGVDVRTNARVSAVRADGIRLAGSDFVPSGSRSGRRASKGRNILDDLDGYEVNRANRA